MDGYDFFNEDAISDFFGTQSGGVHLTDMTHSADHLEFTIKSARPNNVVDADSQQPIPPAHLQEIRTEEIALRDTPIHSYINKDTTPSYHNRLTTITMDAQKAQLHTTANTQWNKMSIEQQAECTAPPATQLFTAHTCTHIRPSLMRYTTFLYHWTNQILLTLIHINYPRFKKSLENMHNCLAQPLTIQMYKELEE